MIGHRSALFAQADSLSQVGQGCNYAAVYAAAVGYVHVFVDCLDEGLRPGWRQLELVCYAHVGRARRQQLQRAVLLEGEPLEQR